VQSMLGRSPSDAFWVEVVDELVVEFQEQLERRSHLENFDTRICDLILGPGLLANCLKQDVGQIWAKQALHQEVDAELEGMWMLGA
jgi:hypothetical protein